VTIIPVKTVSTMVGETLYELGARNVFGVVGSGNYVATAALVDSGATFFSARHESAAVSMADAHFRTTGKLAVASVHQGPGLTNAITALGEAAKSRVPLLVIAGDTSAGSLRSNFYLDQSAVAVSVGCLTDQLYRPETVTADIARAYRRALNEQKPVVLNMPLDIQHATRPEQQTKPWQHQPSIHVTPPNSTIADLADRILSAKKPLILGGRGAWLSGAQRALLRLADAANARLATTAPAKGMFDSSPWTVGIAGGFSTGPAVETLNSADLIMAFGSSLTTWTTRGDTIFDDNPTVIQIDSDPTALGLNAHVNLPVVGDAAATAEALLCQIADQSSLSIFRSHPVEKPPLSYPDNTSAMAHPGKLTARLENLLPTERTVVLDGGHFIGWPARELSVPDPAAFVFTSAGFQSIGLGMGSAIGAAIARPDRLTALMIGDGGFFMGISELETMVRLKLPILVAVYNDHAYGAEVHHFRSHNQGQELVSFPDKDIAAIAKASGAHSHTVRNLNDLNVVHKWQHDLVSPLVLDMKIDPDIVGDWAEQDFLNH